MSEAKREPAFLVVKKRGLYLRIQKNGGCRWVNIASRSMWNPKSLGAGTYAAQEGGKVIPVRVTTRTVRRGHSWAWACKRMLEGKRVRQATWPNDLSVGYYGGRGYVSHHYWGKVKDRDPMFVSDDHMRATDWVVAE